MDSLASHARKTGYWLVLLLLVPIIAAVAAGYLAAALPPQYTVTGLARIDPPTGTPRSQATGIYVDAVTSRPVTDSAAAEVGLSSSAVQPYMSAAARSAEGSPTGLVDVEYRGPDQEQAAAIVGAVAVGAQQLLYGAPIAAAEGAVAVAEREFAEASDAAAEAGLAQKEADLRSYQSRLNNLRNNSDPQEVAAEIADAQAAVDAAQLEIAGLAGIKEESDSKERILLSARKTLTGLQGQLEAVADEPMVKMSAVTTVDPSVAIVRAAMTGAILGFAVAAVVVAVVAITRARPAAADDAPADDAPADAVSPEPTSVQPASPKEVQQAQAVDGLASV